MRRRVAIGIVARTLGGPATYAIEVARALAARPPGGREYVVLTDGPEYFTGTGLEVVEVPLASPYAQVVWDHLAVPRALRRVGADLYHGTKGTLPLAAPCPAVVSIHDLSVYAHPESFALLQRLHLRVHTPLAVRAARRILTGSEHAASDLRARFPAAAGKVVVTPYAVDRRFRRPTDAAALAAFRARHALGPGPLVVYLGTLQPRKNVELLAAAFARVAAKVPTAELVLAGRIRPGYRPDLPSDIRVRLLGPLADAEVPLLFGVATVLVSPSLYEGFGLTLLEAMACGCPVVALRRTSVPEVVADAGVLLDDAHEETLAAALRDLLAAPQRLAELGRRGEARAAGFSWARTAAATDAVYASVLDAPAGSAGTGS